jgi:iron only hydrogenase large subunit-like protein
MQDYFHSVTLDEAKCKGCTNCIKGCPTEAIRVRSGKALIIDKRCIDCGECIRVCPYHAKKAITDSIEDIFSYKHKIALVSPSFYGQFPPEFSRKRILGGLLNLGFDDVFEAAAAAEIVNRATIDLINKNEGKRPLISSSCPAAVRFIQVRYPSLLDNIIKIESPMEIAGKIIRKRYEVKGITGREDVGVFFISPCAAKVTSVRAPYENKESSITGVISMKDIYVRLLVSLKNADEIQNNNLASFEGLRWAISGGESLGLHTDKFLAVDGIHNLASILEAVENDKLEDVDFIEALACTGGCIGGPLTVENVYVARNRLNRHVNAAKKRMYSAF